MPLSGNRPKSGKKLTLRKAVVHLSRAGNDSVRIATSNIFTAPATQRKCVQVTSAE